jgi:CheY-like chemotaxis protein
MSKILVAEDNPADVYLIRTALRDYGVDCPLEVLDDGREVLQTINLYGTVSGAPWSLIILDLNLPRHDGIEILQQLRDTEGLARVPVVVLTSSDSPHDRVKASDLGAVRFLRKPSNLEQFLSLGAVFREVMESADARQPED